MDQRSSLAPALIAAYAAPTSAAQDRLLAVPELLAGLFPSGGLQRGWSVSVSGIGGWSVALALLGPTLAGDSWAGVVGGESLGLVAANELDVRLERLLMVESPGPKAGEVVAALIEAVDVICLGPEVSIGSRFARRLLARAREQGTVLLHLGQGWSEPYDVKILVEPGGWSGIGKGYGHLQSRSVVVSASGRRSMTQPRRVELLLPAPGGGLAPAPVRASGSRLDLNVSV